MIIVFSIVFLLLGILFVGRSRRTGPTDRFLLWIGIALIIMTLFLIAFSAMEYMDSVTPKPGH
ncbi:hypothetical protein JCM10914A_23510 [Paenibacillus sp. JCM 10914]|uniref:hypothetical protein n=1 Tax=Paenibacillus sp. JCM 10914 TaxID=1236974 RepID=UPI0003CC9319|nr:hypothetical protein [Paenibacillus sp. JCM 10914]GAE06008.1 hypothetical protein JCM10914_2147 [Paenibacillus sp. JCM 10914]